jgi:hypothetical protein
MTSVIFQKPCKTVPTFSALAKKIVEAGKKEAELGHEPNRVVMVLIT